MLISHAYAQSVAVVGKAAEAGLSPVEAPDSSEFFFKNVMFVAVMVGLFYVLLIRPQKKRFEEHAQALKRMKKGDTVITGGGLVGVIDKIEDGNEEVIVDLGNGLNVTALRSTLQSRNEPLLKPKAANDEKNKGGASGVKSGKNDKKK